MENIISPLKSKRRRTEINDNILPEYDYNHQLNASLDREKEGYLDRIGELELELDKSQRRVKFIQSEEKEAREEVEKIKVKRGRDIKKLREKIGLLEDQNKELMNEVRRSQPFLSSPSPQRSLGVQPISHLDEEMKEKLEEQAERIVSLTRERNEWELKATESEQALVLKRSERREGENTRDLEKKNRKLREKLEEVEREVRKKVSLVWFDCWSIGCDF